MEWNALSTTSLKAGWMCIPLIIGSALCSGVYIRFTISCIRTEAYGSMMCAPKNLHSAFTSNTVSFAIMEKSVISPKILDARNLTEYIV